MELTVRVGLANLTGRMPAEMERRSLPVLVSANALFDHKKKRFVEEVPFNLNDLDVALDSAGFTAMRHYGGYPWTVEQYVELAMGNHFTWWAQLDCCCEPEIATNRWEVRRRIMATATLLHACREQHAAWIESAPWLGSQPPMPVLQGWQPDDYLWSADLAGAVLRGNWPKMIGIGSVCRRHLDGPDGLWRVLHALDRHLPADVTLHLFGVKGDALARLDAFPRVVSVDSMAFEFEARMQAMKGGHAKTIDKRMEALDTWIDRQNTRTVNPQFDLQLTQ